MHSPKDFRLLDPCRSPKVAGLNSRSNWKSLPLIYRLDGVVGLSLAFCTYGCGFDSGPSRRIFTMQKIDSGYVV
ncbi:hypothetical protein TNCV_3154841 [Trichonephila clavipes]|nr:hypothetical protein TNCV_3154841 [Trichonephila clavipes]